MSGIDGLELFVIGRRKSAELRYEAGQYTDVKGRPLEGVADWSCYSCMRRYYTFEEDPVPFCPSCGLIEGRRFQKREELVKHLEGQNFSYLDAVDRGAFAVSTHTGWELRFAREAYDLERSGRFGQVVALYPPP